MSALYIKQNPNNPLPLVPAAYPFGPATDAAEAAEIDAALDAVLAQASVSAADVAKDALGAMRRLHTHLITTLPYENLSVYYGSEPPSLRPLALVRKMVGPNGRGGFCVELNALYAMLLLRLGFTVDMRTALVTAGVYPGDPSLADKPNTHLTLLVSVPGRPELGRWMCDIGASDFAPMEPLEFVPNRSPEELAALAPQGGSGGLWFTIRPIDWEDRPAWALWFHRLEKTKSAGRPPSIDVAASEMEPPHIPESDYLPFFVYHDEDVPWLDFERINMRVKQPAFCPPVPFFTQYATLPKPNGDRATLIGSRAKGYTFFVRDILGRTIESEKVPTVEKFEEMLLSRLHIRLPE
ncbi:hypothetical protein HK105_202218 [Polyrhizophydium stewartii]|uniref:Arylamine N-acetyltransferase n=1 Tax=Polyrhizophydium stewartii TaxID=2732419 RepID=A0ABR4NFJ2_9FUNG|nr:hypothetical protein HK105_006737 [Polyrhizophydium stewartii]